MSRRNAVPLLALAAACGLGCSDTPQTPGAAGRTHPVREEPELGRALLPREMPARAPERHPEPGDWFEDVTSRTGIDFAYHDGSDAGHYTLLESVGGGVAAFDYDGDGRVDLFFPGGGDTATSLTRIAGRRSRLYRNEGDFEFRDVTDGSGIETAGLYTHGCSAADYDRDGDVDLFVAGYGAVQLWRNRGDGTFEEVAENAGLLCPGWNVTGAFGDYDGDGWVDLYVVTYANWTPDPTRICVNDQDVRDVCGPTRFEGTRDHLFRNRGDGTFEDVSSAAGLVERNRGLGVVAADLDEDGALDFFVVNDVEENQLYRGHGGLPFESVGVVSGVAFSAIGEREGSMGVDLGDFDGDQRPDLWYANYTDQDNSLLRNLGDMQFQNVNARAGVAGMSRPWVGFGTGFADFDGDGWEDVFVANGHVAYGRRDAPYHQPPQLLRNVDGERFEEIGELQGGYFSVPRAGRGAAVADLDDDGAPDLVVVHQDEPIVVLRNRRQPRQWVGVVPVGTRTNPDAIGAKVVVRSGDRSLARWIRGGGGYLSRFDTRLSFALPAEEAHVVVSWPSGLVESFGELEPGRWHRVVEGTGTPEGG